MNWSVPDLEIVQSEAPTNLPPQGQSAEAGCRASWSGDHMYNTSLTLPCVYVFDLFDSILRSPVRGPVKFKPLSPWVPQARSAAAPLSPPTRAFFVLGCPALPSHHPLLPPSAHPSF